MALTGYGRNAALTGVLTKAKWLSIYGFKTSNGEPKYKATSNTAIGGTIFNMTGSEAKGFTNGKIVMIRVLTASVTNPVAERPYYVVGAKVNGFELSLTEGGTAIKVVGAEVNTATEFFLGEEVAVARIATAFGAAAEAEESDTEKIIKIKAGYTATDAILHEKESAGTNKEILDVKKLIEPEPYGSEGEYKATTDKFEAPTSLA